MMGLLWFLACGGPRFTEVAAIAPTLARLDTDKNGTVTEAEYVAVSFKGFSFAAVDTDSSGDLSAAELLTLVDRSNPADLTYPRPAPVVMRGQARQGPQKPHGASPAPRSAPSSGRGVHRSGEARMAALMILESLRAEVLAEVPGHGVPSHEELQAAADSGGINTAESRAVLLKLEAAADAVGADFPASLRAEKLAALPVAESDAPQRAPGAIGEGSGRRDRRADGGPPRSDPGRPDRGRPGTLR